MLAIAQTRGLGIARPVVARRHRRNFTTTASLKAVSDNKAVQVSQEALLTSLPLSMATVLLSSAPAFADEVAGEAAKEAADVMSQNSGILGYTNGGLVIAFSPLVIYGVFYLYRATINPKAKLQDLLFVGAFCVVVANILSIAIFHRRVY